MNRILLLMIVVAAGCRFDFARALDAGELRGRVVLTGADGIEVPAAGTLVRFEGSALFVRADSRGVFAARDVPAGRYDLRFTLANEAGEPVAGTTVRGLEIEEHVGQAGGLDLGTLRLGRLARLDGVVTKAREPASLVRLVFAGGTERLADAAGAFAFENLIPGTYVLAVEEPGSSTWRRSENIELAPGESRTVALELNELAALKPGLVKGRVRTPGAVDESGALVEAFSTSNSSIHVEAGVDVSGAFALGPVDGGVYVVTATGIGGEAGRATQFSVLVDGDVVLPDFVLVPRRVDGGCVEVEGDDSDGDGVLDEDEDEGCRCDPGGRVDLDGDGLCERVDFDDDGDGVADIADNCPEVANEAQRDGDEDGIGDRCQPGTCLHSGEEGAACERDGELDGVCVDVAGTIECLARAGAVCDANRDCVTANCADGVCCDRACDGTCESCRLAGSEGVCTVVPAGDDPDAECTADSCSPGTCNGAGACFGTVFDLQCVPDAPAMRCTVDGQCVLAGVPVAPPETADISGVMTNAFLAHGLTWLFLFDHQTSELTWRTSADLVTWSEPTEGGPSGFGQLAVVFDGTKVTYVTATRELDTPFRIRSGTPMADGTIVWDGPEQDGHGASEPGRVTESLTLSRSTSGEIWVGYVESNTQGLFSPWVSRSTATEGWVTEPGFPFMTNGLWASYAVRALPLADGATWVVTDGNYATSGRVWTAGAFEPEEHIRLDSSRTVSTGASVTSVQGVPRLLLLDDALELTYQEGMPGALEPSESVASGAAAPRIAALSDGTVFAVWLDENDHSRILARRRDPLLSFANWGEEEVCFDGAYPVLRFSVMPRSDGEGVNVFFVTRSADGQPRTVRATACEPPEPIPNL